MNKEYLLYLIRSKKHLSIFMLIVTMLPTLLYVLTLPTTSSYASYEAIEMTLYAYIFIVMAESFILPFVYFSFLQSKRALDTYYNIPISKPELIGTNFIHMSTQIIIFGIIGTLIPVLMNIGFLNRPYMVLALYVLTSIFAIIVSLFVLSIIYKTNSLFDSIVLSLAYITIPFLIVTVLGVFDNHQIYGLTNTFDWLNPYIILLMTCLAPLLNVETLIGDVEMVFDIEVILLIIEALIIGIVCFISIKKDIKRRKAEVSETVSSNFFAWPLAIGLITMCLLFIFVFGIDDTLTMILSFAFVFIAYLIMTFIYRRKIRFTKHDLLLFGIGIFASLTILAIANATDGFYLSRSYRSIDNIKSFDIYVSIEDGQSDTEVIGYDLYNEMTMSITDKETINDVIAIIDDLYERYKSGEDDYVPYYQATADYSSSLYISMFISDDDGRRFDFGHRIYVNDDKDIDDIEKIVALIEDIDGTVSASVYDELYGSISENASISEVRKTVENWR